MCGEEHKFRQAPLCRRLKGATVRDVCTTSFRDYPPFHMRRCIRVLALYERRGARDCPERVEAVQARFSYGEPGLTLRGKDVVPHLAIHPDR